MEVADLRVPARTERLETGDSGKKVLVKVPDLNFLVAKIIFGASSPTRPWHRKLDDIAYLCHAVTFNARHFSRQKTPAYLRKLCDGEKAALQRRANFLEALQIATPAEVAERTSKKRTRASFDYKKEMARLASVFGSKGMPDPRIAISRRVYLLSQEEKRTLAKAHSVECQEGTVWGAMEPKLQRVKPEELAGLPKRPKKQLLKRLRRL